jgi:uncharacterized protein YsxB (DUF464 family)
MKFNKRKVSRKALRSPVPGPAGSSKDRRLPLKTGRIDFARAFDLLLLETLFVFFHDLVREYNDPVTLLQGELVKPHGIVCAAVSAHVENQTYVVSEHVEYNQSLVNILLSHGGEHRELVLAYSFSIWLNQ